MTTHDGGDLVRNFTDLGDVRSAHAKFGRVFQRRADRQTLDTPPDIREVSRDRVLEPRLDRFTRLVVFCHHHDFRKIRCGELLNEKKEEARGTRADVSGVVLNARIFRQDRLHTFRDRLRLREA